MTDAHCTQCVNAVDTTGVNYYNTIARPISPYFFHTDCARTELLPNPIYDIHKRATCHIYKRNGRLMRYMDETFTGRSTYSHGHSLYIYIELLWQGIHETEQHSLPQRNLEQCSSSCFYAILHIIATHAKTTAQTLHPWLLHTRDGKFVYSSTVQQRRKSQLPTKLPVQCFRMCLYRLYRHASSLAYFQ